jgi:hypothetical protein
MSTNDHLLPDELVIEIASYTTCRTTLAALSQSSKRFHVIAEPLLYSTFIQTGEFAESLPRFLRTLSAKPHLGRYVKTIIAESHQETTILDMDFLDERELRSISACVYWV